MSFKHCIACFSVLISLPLWADQSFYCVQNHGFISLGMSQSDVLQACGSPGTKMQSDQPATQKVPVTQLIYNQVGSPKPIYGFGSHLSVGTNSGADVEVDIVDNKVYSIRINSSDSNAMSICGGQAINIGDPVGKVFGSCGSPAISNNTYMNVPLPGYPKPEIWHYKLDPHQDTELNLTFVNGRLQSIDQ